MDSSGNLHAVYRTQSSRIAHYKKVAGFNDSWSQVGRRKYNFLQTDMGISNLITLYFL